ncbi:MAG: cellulose biosynthesis cyclic di-GMP-binding regulatory protein BcsB [Stenomitos rutilans HA7619-LM2]|nr:cellulose biosynthesis cyclic di-GMP-binding regulatory protein BcsB [Stenomitos rutilans HA7619-LM2]
MKRFFHRLQHLSRSPGQPFNPMFLGWSLLLCGSVFITGFGLPLLNGQWGESVMAQSTNVQKQEDQIIRDFTLPKAPSEAPVYRPAPPSADEPPVPVEAAPPTPAPGTTPTPAKADAKPDAKPNGVSASKAPTSQYVLEFNRSPIVGNRLRLQGIYAETQLAFTRPRNWNLKAVQALVRFQHSPALLATRSNLTVRVNGTSVGSTALNRKQSQIGEFLVKIPPNLIQDTNDIAIVAQQNTDPKCSNPADPMLWTEVLPDSKLVFDYQPQPTPLDLSRFPYPFFDNLGLDASQLAYVRPTTVNESWLTATGRFQAAMGRLADFRPLNTRFVKDLDGLRWNDRLIILGTPAEQPFLKDLKLPFAISGNAIIDGVKTVLPGDVGVVMLATTPKGGNPVLVVTGNGPDGIAKAVQYLVQPQNRRISAGQAILVDNLDDVPTPPARQWERALPEANEFKLSDLKGLDQEPFQDTTVRGSSAPPIDVDFHALPDDHFTRGSSMELVYGYGPQVNPRTSTVEVLLDGVAIGGKRLTSDTGATRESLNVNLPETLITPTSKLAIAFRLSAREQGQCGVVTDQQLWGTVHANDTRFKLKRDQSVQLPDLKLLQVGYPFAAPQDLSGTAIVVPDSPSETELLTMLAFSERLGRLSQAGSVKLDAYTAGTLPDGVRKERHLVGIGTHDKFPFNEAFDTRQGFSLGSTFSRLWNQQKIQTLPDKGGVIKEVMSPWNGNRTLLALSGQQASGLSTVKDILNKDPWFFQVKEDTVLISANPQATSDFDPNAYQLEFLQQAPQRRIAKTNLLATASRFLQDNWFLLPTGMVTVCLLLYGIAQLYIKRLEGEKK